MWYRSAGPGYQLTMSVAKVGISRKARQEAQAYAGDEERPLGDYLTLVAGYGVSVAVLTALARRFGRHLPERPALSDLVLLSVATHKLSRRLAKDPVTSPLRAPFTRFSGRSGEAEVAEEVRGTGPRKAVGELVTCPFCLGQWVVTALGFGLVFAPRPTRFACGLLSALTVSDFLQLAYDKAQP